MLNGMNHVLQGDHAIKQTKKFFYKDRLQKLKTQDPSGWHKGIQMVSNKIEQRPIISAPDIRQNDEKAITVEAINKNFASVSQRPSDHHALPAKPHPQITAWEMYRELRKLNAKKSAGHNVLPGKLIKEFVCELSTPVADIFNASLREGHVPQI